jgi:hypothetical protein
MKALLLSAIVLGFGLAGAQSAPMTDLEISSGDFSAGGSIPRRFTCEGKNDNPNIKIDGAPERTRTFALILDDRDAPGGKFTHWLVWNIPRETKEFTRGSVPNRVQQGVNDFGKVGYSGPCPTSGEHRYTFHLYALDTELKLSPKAHRRDVDTAIAGHILGEAKIMARYARETLGK